MLKMKDHPKWRANQEIVLASTFLLLVGSREFLVYDTQLILLRFHLECSGYTHKKCSLCVHMNTSQETTATVGYTTLFDVCLFWQIACLCAVSCNHLPPHPSNNPVLFLLCLLIICKYGRAGKYIKKLLPQMPHSKDSYICSSCTPLNRVFFSHMHSISLLFVSLLFHEQATKVVRSNQGYGFLSPVSFALAKFWSF